MLSLLASQCVKSKSVTNLAEATADPLIDIPLSQQPGPGVPAPPQPLVDGSPPQPRLSDPPIEMGSAPSLGALEWPARPRGIDWGCLLRVQCLGVEQIRFVLKTLNRQLIWRLAFDCYMALFISQNLSWFLLSWDIRNIFIILKQKEKWQNGDLYYKLSTGDRGTIHC